MDAALVNKSNVHQLRSRLPFISCKYSVNNYVFSHIAIVDGGATRSTFPIQRLPSTLRSSIKATSVTLSGVGGQCNLAGAIDFKVYLGDNDTVGHNVNVLITNSGVPALIGQDILSNGSIRSFTQDNDNGCIHFTNVNGTTHTASCIPDDAVKKHFEDHQRGKSLILNSKSCGPPGPPGAPSTTTSHDVTGSTTTPNICKLTSKPVKDTAPPPLTAPFKLVKQWLQSVKLVNIPNTEDQANQMLVKLLHKYEDVIGTPESKLGTFKKVVRIPTNGESRSRPQFPIAQNLKKPFMELIEKMRQDGVIEPCPDPKGFNSPVFPVPKKTPGQVRCVVNFRPTLNKVIKDLDPWTMPSVESVLQSIPRGCKYFACLDLRDGYFQLKIHEEDRHKTAFQVGNTCMQFVRVPMGLTSAGAIFSREVAEVINSSGIDNVVAYLDDLVVFGQTEKEFFDALEGLFKVLRQNGLLLNGRKCEFLKSTVQFLGRQLSADGIGVVPDYVTSILNLRSPTTKKEAQRLIGRMVWINSFLNSRTGENLKLCNFSAMMKHILETVTHVPFKWTDQAEKSFKKLKKRLSNPPVIQFADYNLPFTLTTDASLDAAGAVIMQEGPNGEKRIIATASKKFNKTERNWSATEREAFALKWGVTKFDFFLANRPFVVFTDHRSLIYMDRREFNNPKIKRWQAELQPYSFVVQYIEGESNVFADMLSRDVGAVTKVTINEDHTPAGKFKKIENSRIMIYIPSWVDGDDVVDVHVNENKYLSAFHVFGNDQAYSLAAQNIELLVEQEKDSLLAKIIHALKIGKNPDTVLDSDDHRYDDYVKRAPYFCLEPGSGVLQLQDGKKYRMVIPYHMRYHMLHRAHDNCNHSGITRVTELLDSVWWESKHDDIRNWCKSCDQCSRRKGRYGMRQSWPDGHLERGQKPFEVVYLDFIQMPMSKGKRYCLTMECAFSRYVIVIPTAHDRAIDACRGLYHLYLQHRCIPRVVSTDRGSHFTASMFKEFCGMMGTISKLHCPWRPQSTGNLERQHRTLKNAIFIVCNGDVTKWTDIVAAVVSNMNSVSNAATGVSAHEIVFGRKPYTGIPGNDTDLTAPNVSEYVKLVKSRQIKVFNAVRIAAAATDKIADDKANHVIKDTIEIGDEILLFRPQSVQAQTSKQNWIGPYTVVKTNQMVVQFSDDDGKLDWTHMSQVRKLTQRNESLTVPIPPVATSSMVPPTPSTIPIPTQSSDTSPTPNSSDSHGQDVSVEQEVQQHQRETSRPQRNRQKTVRLIETMDANKKSYFTHDADIDDEDIEIKWIPPPPAHLIAQPRQTASYDAVSMTTRIVLNSNHKDDISIDSLCGENDGTNDSLNDDDNDNEGEYDKDCSSASNAGDKESDIPSMHSSDVTNRASEETADHPENDDADSTTSEDDAVENPDIKYVISGASKGMVSSHILDTTGLNSFLDDVTITRTINLMHIKDYQVLRSLNEIYSNTIWPAQDESLAVNRAKRNLAKLIIEKQPMVQIECHNNVKWPFVPLTARGSQRVTNLAKSIIQNADGRFEGYPIEHSTYFELAQACVQLNLQLKRSDLNNKMTLTKAIMKAPLQQNFRTIYHKNILYICKEVQKP